MRKSRYSFDKVIKDFEQSKNTLRPNTIKRYKPILTQFKLFVDALGLKYVDEFNSDHGTLLLNEIVKERIDPKGVTDRILKPKPKTVNMYLQVIKALFREEQIKGHIIKNPLIHIKNLKAEKRTPDFYSADELKRFFSQEMNEFYRNTFLGLFYTGMRFAELANLTWDDVDLNSRLIHVRSTEQFKTKTAKGERAIPISDELFEILKDMKLKNTCIYTFPAPNGKQLRERQTLAVCKQIANAADIKSNAYLHKFRHTYATYLIRKGVPIQDIKELLGHSSVVETEIYAHNNSDHLHDKIKHLGNILNSKDEKAVK